MKPTRSVGQLAVVILSLSSSVQASWAWPRWLPHLDALIVRQDSNATETTSSADNATSVISTNLNTGGLTSGTVTATGTAKSKSASTTKHTTYDATDPAGSVVMITPAATAGTQLYKIGDYVTWGWNYTNLLATPTAVDVLISCSTATETFTLTQNMTFASPGSFTWDSGAFQSSAIKDSLPIAEYTLLIFEAGSSISATAEPGYLAPFSQATFGLYTGQPYTPLGEWQCATCSGALSDMERRAVGAAMAMSVVTVLSFTWFVTGFRIRV